VTGTASNTTIGGTNSGANNVSNTISGNEGDGIYIDVKTIGNLIAGNLIGPNLPGLQSKLLGNGRNAVYVLGRSVTIQFNFIEGNADNGIFLDKSASAGNLLGNLGIDNNGANGILVQGTNTAMVALNAIGGNKQAGVSIQNGASASASASAIQGNGIGLDLVGTKLPNQTGVKISDSSLVTIGGTNKGGTSPLPNKIGVLLDGTAFQIGGPNSNGAPMQGNVISGNTTYGIELSATGGTQEIFGNDIGTTPTASAKVGNLSDGVYIVKVKASGVMVGSLNNGNLISGNGGSGVAIVQSQNKSVAGNYIGTNSAGDVKIANGMDGVRFDQSSDSTVENNLISGNTSGVVLTNASHGNTIGGNTIGTDPGLTMNLGNAEFGVLVNGNSNQNTIGGNVIAFNTKGVVIGSSPADNSSQDSVLGNSPRVDPSYVHSYHQGRPGHHGDGHGPWPGDWPAKRHRGRHV
jgi:parallel beta-helix repeat protein